MSRPSVDVVVPYAGPAAGLRQAAERLATLALRPADTVVLVDNGPRDRPPVQDLPVPCLTARDRASSYYARNAGARRGRAAWILFLDGDVGPPPDLLDRYFDESPAEDTGQLAGGVLDAPPTNGRAQSHASRYVVERRLLHQDITLDRARFAYPVTANTAVRRTAFEQVGGFDDGVISGGDGDLAFRLRNAGWRLERRDAACVVHHSRTSVRGLLRQVRRHGAGVAWLDSRHPGSGEPPPASELLRVTARAARDAATGALRRERHAVVFAVLDVLKLWSFEYGRRYVSNDAGPARPPGPAPG